MLSERLRGPAYQKGMLVNKICVDAALAGATAARARRVSPGCHAAVCGHGHSMGRIGASGDNSFAITSAFMTHWRALMPTGKV